MAWLHNLADRAENLLNKIDQNAATVLSENSKSANQPEGIITNTDEEDKPFSSSEDLGNVNINNSDSIEANENRNLQIEFNNTAVELKEKAGSSLEKSFLNSFVLTEDAQTYNESINKLECEVQDLNKQLLNLKHLYAELRNENSNLQLQVETLNYLVKTAQAEMEQHKARAQRILEKKEELISVNQNEDTKISESLLLINEELKKEVEFQQNKNKELSEKLQKFTKEISLLQQQIVLTQNSFQQTNDTLQSNLTSETRIRMMAEEDCRLKTRELRLKNQELEQQFRIIETKNEEISTLKDALRRKSTINSNDLELRIKSLSDTLMLKQNTLETVTSERNALRIQLEKSQAEYENKLTQLQRAQVQVINMNDNDDGRSEVPQFMRVTPFDAGVTRKVKHAYSSLNAISIRTGVFLRRYPIARVCVFSYMVLLQFWALIVLLVYAPSSR